MLLLEIVIKITFLLVLFNLIFNLFMTTRTSESLLSAIKSQMKNLNLTLLDLAVLTGLNPSGLRRILDGKFVPSIDVFERIGTCLGLRLLFVLDIIDVDNG